MQYLNCFIFFYFCFFKIFIAKCHVPSFFNLETLYDIATGYLFPAVCANLSPLGISMPRKNLIMMFLPIT